MAYSDIASLSADNDFIQRVAACAATEGVDDPYVWSMDHRWQLAASPGFGEAYAYALATGVVRPGNDPAVISDGMILSAGQPMMSP